MVHPLHIPSCALQWKELPAATPQLHCRANDGLLLYACVLLQQLFGLELSIHRLLCLLCLQNSAARIRCCIHQEDQMHVSTEVQKHRLLLHAVLQHFALRITICCHILFCKTLIRNVFDAFNVTSGHFPESFVC